MFGSIGMPELIIIFVIALIIFGPRKLPELGRSLGKSLGEFKRASNELRSSLEEEIRIEEQRDTEAARAKAKAEDQRRAEIDRATAEAPISGAPTVEGTTPRHSESETRPTTPA